MDSRLVPPARSVECVVQEAGLRELRNWHRFIHDPFIAPRAVGDLGVALVTLDELLERSDYITLHVPATPETRHLINASTLARCKRGVRVVNTARGELIDEAALADGIEAGVVSGAALDVFETEPPRDNRLTQLPQVIATPHIAASTVEAQELVGTEIAVCVRDYLREGVIRNAVNFPSIPQEDFVKLRPFLLLADRLGAMAAQLAAGGAESMGIRYYGPLTDRYADVYNHKIHYNDVGQGPALFCFHGGGPGSNAWDNTKHNLDALAEHFRCIIMDMPGYGLSDKDVKRDEPLDIFCSKIILGLVDHLGIDKTHLYGSSQFSACCLRFSSSSVVCALRRSAAALTRSWIRASSKLRGC